VYLPVTSTVRQPGSEVAGNCGHPGDAGRRVHEPQPVPLPPPGQDTAANEEEEALEVVVQGASAVAEEAVPSNATGEAVAIMGAAATSLAAMEFRKPVGIMSTSLLGFGFGANLWGW
jgi:hypothetical protein